MALNFGRIFSGLIFFLSLAFPVLGQSDGNVETGNKFSDGPYIYVDGDSLRLVRAIEGVIVREALHNDGTFTVTSSDGAHSFGVTLYDITVPEWNYTMPGKMTVLSDPHGNMDAYVSILTSAGIMDDSYEWTYGDGHFVLLGDIFDRGDDVLPIFWLTYKLAGEAVQSGGMVHFLPGNHESMVVSNDLRYATQKYKDLAEMLGVEYKDLWTTGWVLGEWLSTRNFIERIGDDLFAHAGLSEKSADTGLDIPGINELMREYWLVESGERKENPVADFLYRTNGPLWYRGMVKPDSDSFDTIDGTGVLRVLQHFGGGRIFVGHTIFDEVCSFFEGRVIAVNVNNAKNLEDRKSRGVTLENGEIYLIYDNPGAKKKWDPAVYYNGDQIREKDN